MTDLEKLKPTRKKKPPTQTAGVSGIDAHKPMGSDPVPRIDWQKLMSLPAFEMFVQEQSGFSVGVDAAGWVMQRRATLSDSILYEQYASWHKDKGLWVGELPTGVLING